MSDPYQIQATPAYYQVPGREERTRFRSLLEARWGMAFWMMHHEWRYEPHTFHMPRGRRYTPDFYLEDVGWIEIKPHFEALQAVEDKLSMFARYKADLIESGAVRRVFSIDVSYPSYGKRGRPGSVLQWEPGEITQLTKKQALRALSPPQDHGFIEEHPLLYVDFADRVFDFTRNARFEKEPSIGAVLRRAVEKGKELQAQEQDAS